MKIKTRLFIGGLLLSVLPIILISAVTVSIYDKELNQIVINELKSITTAQIDIIDNFFYERDVNISVLSEYHILHSLLEQSNEKDKQINQDYKNMVADFFMMQKKNKKNFIHSITALDLNFRIMACTEPTKPGEISLLKDTELVNDIKKEIWFSEILEEGENGVRSRCLIAVKAIYNEEGKHIGYLVEEITLEFIQNLRISTNLIKEGSIYITDGTGKMISAGTGSSQIKDYVLDKNKRGSFSKAWENRNKDEAVGVIRYTIDGKTYLSSYGGFNNSNWEILSSVCLDDILHVRENVFYIFSAALLVTVFLLLAINSIMNKTIINPIEQMIQTFAYIRKEKDFGGRIKEIPLNELGVIAKEVNSLLNDIEVTINHQEEKLSILKERAQRDCLTGMFNKNAIKEIFTIKIENAHVDKNMFACVLVDIDDFKWYNTNFGHPGGDKVIQFVGSYMKEISCDTAGRIGGDEFVMCLDAKSSNDDFVYLIEKFIAHLKEGIDIAGDGKMISVSCSIGVAKLNEQMDTSYESLINMADKTMYQVKNSTKNGYSIYQE